MSRRLMSSPSSNVEVHPGMVIIHRRYHSRRDLRSRAAIREVARFRKMYGRGRWRKRKGVARVRLADGSVHLADVHWYEASGVGKREFKIKRLL
jgi:hypothetical protein